MHPEAQVNAPLEAGIAPFVLSRADGGAPTCEAEHNENGKNADEDDGHEHACCLTDRA